MPNDTDRNEVRTIVAATDFSDTAGRALARAGELAIRHSARLVLAHAVTIQPIVLGGPEFTVLPPDFDEQVREASWKRLEALAAEWRGRGIEVETRLELDRSAGARIAAMARDEGANLLVTGTRGLGGFRHLLLGSTAEEIVRRATCPVLSIHPGDDASLVDVKTVLLPTDFSEDAGLAAEEAVRLFDGRAGSPRFVLVHCDQRPAFLDPLIGDLAIARVAFADVHDGLVRRLEPIAERLRARGLAVETFVKEGEPATLVNELADLVDADLIAMGTRGRSGLGRALLGSTAARTVQHAKRPVLTVRCEPADEAGRPT